VILGDLALFTGMRRRAVLHGSSLVVCDYAHQKPNSIYLAGSKIDDVGKQNVTLVAWKRY